MASGAPFQHGVPISSAELNQKTITYTDDVTNETAMPGQVFYCKANAGSYYKDDVVSRKIDDDGYSLISQNKHMHNADTNRAGGLFSSIIRANVTNLLMFHKAVGFGPSDIHTYGSASATIALDSFTGAAKWDTGTTAGNYLVSKLMGVSPSLATQLMIHGVMQYHGNYTNVFCRLGVNLEPMDISNNTDAKFGLETCAGSNNNWNIVSAEGGGGSARTTMNANASLEGDTTVGQGTSRRGHHMEYTPGSFINYVYQGANTVSKSTNLPNPASLPGTIPYDNAIDIGLKTTDTNSKQLYIWGLAFIGEVKDVAWNVTF